MDEKEEKTILWAACVEAAANLIAGGVAGNAEKPGWPEIQVMDVAKRLYEAAEEAMREKAGEPESAPAVR